jgi:hypothetical protein
LAPHVSEISIPIQKSIELGRLGELDLLDPAGTLGVFIGSSGLPACGSVTPRISPLTGEKRSLAALTDSTTPTAPPFRTCAPTCGSCYSNGSDTVLDDDVLVILNIS